MSIFGWLTGIAVWIVLGLAAFAIFEARGFRHEDRAGVYTLSFALYTLGKKFPLSIFASGFVLGAFIFGLAVHFNWHWCPEGAASVGQLVPLVPQIEKPVRLGVYCPTMTYKCDQTMCWPECQKED